MFPQNIPETPLSHPIPNKAPASHSTNLTQPSKFSPISPEKSTEKKVGKWTPEEDELLRKYVSLYSEKQWKKVSEHIPGRTPIQCLHRWTKILKPGLVKGPWTQEEDQKLIAWVKKEGPGKWAQAANLIPGRSGKQCRERWFNNLNPEVKKGNWSTAEDELIFDLYQKYGSSWSKIAKYIPGRTENSIKNRFYSTLRKLAAAKHRVTAGPLASEFGKLDTAVKGIQITPSDLNLRADGSGSEQDPNILYNLLQESSYKADQQESQANAPELNVKQEEGLEAEEKAGRIGKTGKESKKLEDKKEIPPEMQKKAKVSEKGEEKSGKRLTIESSKPPEKTQAFNVNGEKVILQRDLNMPEQAIYQAANKLIQSNVDENDLNFQRFLLSIDNNVYNNDLILRDPATTKPIPANFDDIDNLQQKILDFCSRNIHDLMSAFKSISADEPVNNPKDLRELLLKQPKAFTHDQAYPPSYNLLGASLSQGGPERLNLLQNAQGFRRSHHPQQQQSILSGSIPLTPISLKIPPLEKKGQEEVRIPKFMGFPDKDLSSVIPAFPNKSSVEKPEKFSVESKESAPSSVLFERRNINNEQPSSTSKDNNNDKNKGVLQPLKQKSEFENIETGGPKKENENLDNLIKSMNNTIGTASLVYAQHLAQINDAMKNMDQKESEETKEKIGGLFQQLYGLETWLRNAKTELTKLENAMSSQESGSNKGAGGNVKTEESSEKGKRRFADENVDSSKLAQTVKKRKVE